MLHQYIPSSPQVVFSLSQSDLTEENGDCSANWVVSRWEFLSRSIRRIPGSAETDWWTSRQIHPNECSFFSLQMIIYLPLQKYQQQKILRCQDAVSRATLHKNSDLRWPTTLNLSKHSVSLGCGPRGHNKLILGFSQKNQSHVALTLTLCLLQ